MIINSESGSCSSFKTERIFTSKGNKRASTEEFPIKFDLESMLKDQRRLEELVTLWYQLCGKSLSAHARLRENLYRISKSLGNPIASGLTKQDFVRYQEKRSLEVTTATINREYACLNTMFNDLIRQGVIKFENPLLRFYEPKNHEKEVRFLNHNEIGRLLDECQTFKNRSLLSVVKVCLATGAKWGEAEALKPSQIERNQITFLNPNSSKSRTVPINHKLYDELIAVNPFSDTKMFFSSLSTFRKAITKADISLPKGQVTHVLRHTFASHYIMNGGSIVKLRDVLGHSTITTTMRYAHLAPDHLEETILLNPLNQHQGL